MSDPNGQCQASQFEAAAQQAAPTLVREFWDFLLVNKKWWLFPIVAVLICVGALVALSGTAVAPFIYTLF